MTSKFPLLDPAGVSGNPYEGTGGGRKGNEQTMKGCLDWIGSGVARRRSMVWVAYIGAFAASLALLSGPSGSRAGSLPAPTGEVLLVVTGDISNTNADGEARFDRQMLEALGTTQLATRTPWHEKGAVFEGIRADRLMAAVAARGQAVRATAANDYRVTIPIADFAAHNVLLAMRIDGKDLTLRTKGPIWVIYPEQADLPAGERSERMIWQLVRLRVQ